MKIEHSRNGFTIDFEATPSTRRCGDCQLCCKLLPVRELRKRGNTRCPHQKHRKGCTIYHQPEKGFPPSCGLWHCVWLSDPSAGLKRPDHCHYVIDPIPDYIEISHDDDVTPQRINVIQVWLDPAYPDAHRDPALRSYLADAGERHALAALIRLNESDGWVLFPPALTPNGQWEERGSSRRSGDTTRVVGERRFWDYLKG